MKIHIYKGITFQYVKTGKTGGYYHDTVNLGSSIENAKWYIDWCFANPQHKNNFLK